MADESKASDFGNAAAITPDFMAASEASFRSDPKNLLARNAIAGNMNKSVILSRPAVVKRNHVFSHKFAATNIMRLPTMKKYNLPNDFEFSQSYLFFHDKLEKSNFFLENIIDTADEAVGSRIVQHLLSDPISDGGQWSMVTSLINTYGLVPKSVFPECHTSSNSRTMNRFLINQLRGFACELRDMKAGGADAESLRTRKAEMMSVVHRILLIHFGEPPKTFEWSFYDKDGKFQCFADLTPTSFYQDMVPFDVNDYVSLINDPRNDYMKLYTVDRLGNIVGGAPVAYINVPIDVLKLAARQTIEAGKPVWFGCDVGKHLDRVSGVMDSAQFDYDLAYGTKPKMTKAQRLLYHESLMTHAMVFTGFDARGEQVNKWRVENSWGTEKGDKGYYIMTDDWFNEFMYQVVVEKSTLEASVAAVLDQTPVVLPAWDPMGSLAKPVCTAPNCACSSVSRL